MRMVNLPFRTQNEPTAGAKQTPSWSGWFTRAVAIDVENAQALSQRIAQDLEADRFQLIHSHSKIDDYSVPPVFEEAKFKLRPKSAESRIAYVKYHCFQAIGPDYEDLVVAYKDGQTRRYRTPSSVREGFQLKELHSALLKRVIPPPQEPERPPRQTLSTAQLLEEYQNAVKKANQPDTTSIAHKPDKEE